MQAVSKTLVFLLLAAVISVPLLAQGSHPDAPAQERTAGCHHNDSNVPAPGPVSHSCCQNGHHPAMLQRSSSSRPSLQASVLVESFRHAAMAASLSDLSNLVIGSGDPPTASPLRL